LLQHTGAEQVDAVFVSHGHPDHCADLNPLLRARALRDDPPAALPLYAPPGALDAVLALDRPGMLADAYVLTAFTPAAAPPPRRRDHRRPVRGADPAAATLAAQCRGTADGRRPHPGLHRRHRPEPGRGRAGPRRGPAAR